MIKTINVTKKDINNGEPGQCNTCAISQALKRIFKAEEAYTEVNEGEIAITLVDDLDNEKQYELYEESYHGNVLDFIHRFDTHLEYEDLGAMDCKPPNPISFKIIEI